LIRIVRSEEGVKVDLTGKAPGRGAYIHGLRSCWDKAMKGSVARALKTELTDQDRQTLMLFVQTLPVEVENDSSRDLAADADAKKNEAISMNH
jgi:predicted RNA-binding protein YlxR (DUF448 family)